ncbi:hypothetical protein KFL_007200030 [Klebsormidium nitens]|uniref:Uncharacterized protein n=1 Tax=Klebsormidium nitens TaxID=105231 RepID=A0A1Y1IJT3_KLENI|nr:hypothetical protein KFL_007200030 [Klebsormidium nitens]|eukprot:GAQ91054.1 hypothetical protein KFL_007200030 [Klebsormidium nitens]
MARVYVGGLDPRATERELEDIFVKFGVLRSVWVARKPPGFAFIEFDDPRDADDAIRDLDGKNGWRVELSRARDGPRRGRDEESKCYECGEYGHFARECRNRRGGGRGRSRSPGYRRRFGLDPVTNGLQKGSESRLGTTKPPKLAFRLSPKPGTNLPPNTCARSSHRSPSPPVAQPLKSQFGQPRVTSPAPPAVPALPPRGVTGTTHSPGVIGMTRPRVAVETTPPPRIATTTGSATMGIAGAKTNGETEYGRWRAKRRDSGLPSSVLLGLTEIGAIVAGSQSGRAIFTITAVYPRTTSVGFFNKSSSP